jgi:hypothetical protein
MIYQEGDIIITKCNDWPWPCKHYGIVGNYNNRLCVFNNTPSKTNSYGGNVVAQPLHDFLAERCILQVNKSNIKSADILDYCKIVKNKRWTMDYNCVRFIEDIKQLEKK